MNYSILIITYHYYISFYITLFIVCAVYAPAKLYNILSALSLVLVLFFINKRYASQFEKNHLNI